jgi:DNA topoisomerase VI subunit B
VISLDTRQSDIESMRATWRAHSAVGRTVTDDSFKGGWEDALYELIKNSIDADARRIRVTCPATDLVPAEQRLVSVEDDGHGMTPEAVRDKFCVVGRAKKSHDGERSPGGRRLYGERGTGRLACFVVAGQVEVETTARGKTSRLELTRAFIRSETQDATQEVEVSIKTAEPKRHGTRVTLTSFQHGLPMPTADAVGRWILRRFGEPSARIEINGRRFAPTDYGEEVARFDV